MSTQNPNPLPPMTPPRPLAERPTIDWDKPVGYAHAANILGLIR
jgi:hypothetical protein